MAHFATFSKKTMIWSLLPEKLSAVRFRFIRKLTERIDLSGKTGIRRDNSLRARDQPCSGPSEVRAGGLLV